MGTMDLPDVYTKVQGLQAYISGKSCSLILLTSTLQELDIAWIIVTKLFPAKSESLVCEICTLRCNPNDYFPCQGYFPYQAILSSLHCYYKYKYTKKFEVLYAVGI